MQRPITLATVNLDGRTRSLRLSTYHHYNRSGCHPSASNLSQARSRYGTRWAVAPGQLDHCLQTGQPLAQLVINSSGWSRTSSRTL
jgi:hypothetical protein